jgi:exopolysaccharide biosynthesis polyprenyl glycosylphosphotransferase
VTAIEVAPSVRVLNDPRTRPVPAGTARWSWESTYIRALVGLDLLAGAIGSVAVFSLEAGIFEMGTAPSERFPLFVMLLFSFAWILALVCGHAYDSRLLFVGNDEYQSVFRASIGLAAAISIAAFLTDSPHARLYVLLAIPLTLFATVGIRFALRQSLHASWSRGERLRRVVVVGHEPAVAQMSRQLRRERYHGYGVVGVCLPSSAAVHHAIPRDGAPPVYGTFDDVASAVRRAGADSVLVLSCPELDGARLRRLAWQLENDDIDLIVASTLVDVAGDRTTVRPVDGLPLLHVEHPELRGTRRVVKEVFDRVAALLGLIAIAPVLLIIAALIRAGGGPALFRQVRVGRDGREFKIFKFRTMYVDAEARLAELMDLNEQDGALFKMRNDPRITPVGRWLRRFSLDELPQLINVVLGDMSLVGPRPPLPAEVAVYPADMRRRLVVKPGMTGLWQVSGRSDLSWEESIRLDLRYVENWSLTMDLVILARTISAVARISGAY